MHETRHEAIKHFLESCVLFYHSLFDLETGHGMQQWPSANAEAIHAAAMVRISFSKDEAGFNLHTIDMAKDLLVLGHPPTSSGSASTDRLLQQILQHLDTQQQHLDRLEHGQHTINSQIFLIKQHQQVHESHLAKSLACFSAPISSQGWIVFFAVYLVWNTAFSRLSH
ncbi:hypothetical protein BCR37DRAFT_162980 [Protomyces lactucae-debilis]|uniref:Uncharacterized protein n=1 Tax=Protomyces lactucae-debilis TaxID=2754530 RepID=A0A1Y2EYL5_PROLT|nr:uncharacterized protein BCR37DRAFT_162980 [Protomyces lactucae-debilis]ORY76712.1 hypothetical protein BCR37DRAFT_162980 [Protomyces lactucae-debilis]